MQGTARLDASGSVNGRRIERDTGWTAHSLQYQSRSKSIQVSSAVSSSL